MSFLVNSTSDSTDWHLRVNSNMWIQSPHGPIVNICTMRISSMYVCTRLIWFEFNYITFFSLRWLHWLSWFCGSLYLRRHTSNIKPILHTVENKASMEKIDLKFFSNICAQEIQIYVKKMKFPNMYCIITNYIIIAFNFFHSNKFSRFQD